MLKAFGTIIALSLGLSFACSGTFYYLRGEEIEPGVFQVFRGQGLLASPGGDPPLEPVGISRVSDFKTHVANLIASNELVFIGAIDSIIGDGLTSASAPGLVPDVVLAPEYAAQTYGIFYARLKVDTLIKGSLPSRHFWFKGYGYGSSCNVPMHVYKAGRFLNFSNTFDKMTDLKLPKYSSFCSNCPVAHWFDGRYLRSPDFPVLRLDITEIYPTYPATGILRRGVPWRRSAGSGKAYQPDGRRVEETKMGHKTPLPVLKKP
jgi:hypothetical protein